MCVMVVHAGVFIGFGAILMKPFISELIACSGAWSYTAAAFCGQNVRAFLLVFPERAAPSWLCGAARRARPGLGTKDRDAGPARLRTAPSGLYSTPGSLPALLGPSQPSRVPHSPLGSLPAPGVPPSPRPHASLPCGRPRLPGDAIVLGFAAAECCRHPRLVLPADTLCLLHVSITHRNEKG